MIKHYIFTYESNNEPLVLQRKEAGLPNMVFRMHSSGVHVYHSNEKNRFNITFLNTVSENIKSFTGR